MSQRADVAIVQAGLFDSRAKAREAIEAGLVTVNGIVITKVATMIGADAVLAATPAYPWVSRGGVKLAAALDHFGFDPSGRRCLDVGASTGGFSHVLLTRGAAHVTAIDVGRGQLHRSLSTEPRLHHSEGLDARDLDADLLGEPPTLVVCDVSFISLRLVLPHVLALAAEHADVVALVKPQFEAGFGRVKKGVVRDIAIHAEVCAEIVALVTGLGWTMVDVIPSPIEGQDGNREFLLGATR
ncbi:TlyA family RNA methyltransferase [Lichenihabitans sp. PAMC28606]|uniref:TlyA family RNA methyltransferase n=1 Tax=Lichenihabitans sp. PAMC28606 TaxID=2880932 RepID=UPI001D0AC34E|nr:TlyA family RNA methyltransferase [Lichenihabitans sp. PAMC28606]UDL95029.1 TlyA family RNA methyltransferase [Lichenihabitans sp. PAMC28606]